MKFTLRQLTIFVALAETQHFGRAAEQLSLSQPTVSSDLRNLERALKVELFHRSRAGTTLTAAGADLVPRARRILAEATELRDAAAEWSDEPMTVQLAASPSLINQLVPSLLRELAESQSDVTVQVVEVATGGVEDAVSSGTAHLGIGHYVHPIPGAGHGTVGHDELEVLAAPRLLTGADPIDLSSLSDQALLLWPRRQHPQYFDAVVEICRSRGWNGEVIETETRFTGANSYLLTGGRAFSLVSADFASDAPASLAGRPITPPARIPFHVLWREPLPRGVAQVLAVLTRLRHP